MQSDANFLGADGDAKERLGRPFEKVVEAAVVDGNRDGCFMCNSSLDQAQLDPLTREVIGKMMQGVHEGFIAALSASAPYAEDEEEREIKAAELLATYFGMRVLVRADASEKVLRNVVRSALGSIRSEEEDP